MRRLVYDCSYGEAFRSHGGKGDGENGRPSSGNKRGGGDKRRGGAAILKKKEKGGSDWGGLKKNKKKGIIRKLCWNRASLAPA